MSKTVAAQERQRLRRKAKRKDLRKDGVHPASGPSMGLAQMLAYMNWKGRRPLYSTPEPKELS